MRRLVWTGAAILGAVLVESALSYLFPGPGRYLDPFLLVVVYAALLGGEMDGMLTGVTSGWVQDALFGGRVLGLSALSKLIIGFFVALASNRFLITSTAARALTVLLASVVDALLVPWLASVFTLEVLPLGPLELVARAALNALVGGMLLALVERRMQRSLS